MLNTQAPRIGDLLLARDLITEQELQAALKKQEASGERLGDLLIETGHITALDLVEVLSDRLGIPKMELTGFNSDPEVIHTLPLRIAKKHQVIALFKINDTITVAMADPLDMVAMDEIRYQTGLRVNRVISTPEDIDQAIARFYSVEQNVERVISGSSAATSTTFDSPDSGEDTPIIQLVDVLLSEAIKQRASDMHIEPLGDSVRVRFRVDGILREEAHPPSRLHTAIVSRIKVLAGMDVSEKRIPQDGRFAMTTGSDSVDLRVSTIPTIHGEKVVIRILGRKGMNVALEHIGLTEKQQLLLGRLLAAPEGMILICGPTSSGKTTTLYASLSEITSTEKNIVTVEDPVEYALPHINQVQVNEKAGLDFPLCLRAFLRQNPDVIMVGEVRDTTTAQIAIRAAMTGHLLLSTIHTIDAAAAPYRLIDMGVEPFLVATALRAAVAQRLIRKLCPDCAVSVVPTPLIAEQLGFESDSDLSAWKEPTGCPACRGSGYRGQIGIFEIMVVDDPMRRLISEGQGAVRLREYAREQGFVDMRSQARVLIASGVTSAEEVMRVVPQQVNATASVV